MLIHKKNMEVIYYEINQFLLENNIIGVPAFYYLNYDDPQNQFIAIDDPTTFNSNDMNGEIIFVVYQNPDPLSCYQLLLQLGPMKSLVAQDNVYYFGEIFISERDVPIPNGVGKMKYQSGAEYYGQWSYGKMKGRGTYTLSNGDTYDGYWNNNAINGYGTFTSADGVYIGEFRDGSIQGKGKKFYANGDIYDGYWINNVKHGWGHYTWKKGKQYFGEFRNDQKDGKGTMVFRDGTILHGIWKKDACF